MDKLKQIASEAGVSSSTVLRILRGENKEVWSSSIRRAQEVRALAQKLGYLPNSSARAVRRGRFDCAALVLSANRGHSYLPDELFNHIHDALGRQQMKLIVSKLPDEKLTDERLIPAILRSICCDGLLINYTDHIPQEMVRLLSHYKIPSVWLNTRQESDCVYYDDFGGAMAVTEHLLKLGHKRIAYLDFVMPEPPDHMHYSRIDRYAGYAQAMRAAGLEPYKREHFAGVPIDQRLTTTRQLLRSHHRPTAIISYDAAGERIMYAAALEGLRVPEDLSVAMFAFRPAPDRQGSIGRKISSAIVPSGKAGEAAVQMLMDKIDSPRKKLPAHVIPLEFDLDGTCAPAPV